MKGDGIIGRVIGHVVLPALYGAMMFEAIQARAWWWLAIAAALLLLRTLQAVTDGATDAR